MLQDQHRAVRNRGGIATVIAGVLMAFACADGLAAQTNDAVAVACSGSRSSAVRADGTVWAWGSNADGQLGDGTSVSRSAPVQVHGLTNAVAVTCGANHTPALRADGTVWAWGNNWDKQLGAEIAGLRPVRVGALAASGNQHCRGANDTCTVRFAPNGYTGTWTAVISIARNDSSANPFTFAVRGTSVVPAGPPVVTRYSIDAGRRAQPVSRYA